MTGCATLSFICPKTVLEAYTGIFAFDVAKTRRSEVEFT